MVAALIAALALSGPTATPATALEIAYWRDGRPGARKAWTLRCGPVGGTLAKRADACRRLGAMRAPFAPLPKDRVCTELYGGPAEAVVSGRYRGARIWVHLRLRDGCEIERWRQLRFLTPGLALNGGG
jgi:hypothetical protein